MNKYDIFFGEMLLMEVGISLIPCVYEYGRSLGFRAKLSNDEKTGCLGYIEDYTT